jgi:hypothetical protein
MLDNFPHTFEIFITKAKSDIKVAEHSSPGFCTSGQIAIIRGFFLE